MIQCAAAVDASRSGRAGRAGMALPARTLIGLVIAILAVASIAFFTYRSLQTREDSAERVTHTFEVVQQLEELLSDTKDAETGQRGFLLAGEERYLEPYTAARASLPGRFRNLRSLLESDVQQLQRLETVEQLTAEKMAELKETIDLKRSRQDDAALTIVRTDRGRAAMDRIRGLVGEMETEERRVLTSGQETWREAVVLSSRITWGGSLLLIALIGAAGFVMSHDFRARETQAWIQTGQMAFSERIQGEQRLEALGDNVLRELARLLDPQVGAVYIAEEDGRFRRFATYAFPNSADDGAVLRPGDSLVGQAAKENRLLHVTDVPEGYLPVTSSLGTATPATLLVTPASVDSVVYAVVELGFFRDLRAADMELLARVSDTLAVAVRTSNDRTRLELLLEETQRQAEELQTQQEELRVNNEELEEQSRALRESQVRLESQQEELEQINAQLEEQAQLLEHRKNELSESQDILMAKAAELERANQYKSEFLANMSHELRTPLNSSLILAKLLADNKEGNLTPKQVSFAQTISSAGNDLLALINDVLDLSKIEAGKVDVSPEPIVLARLLEGLTRTFQAIAREKKLAFNIAVEPGTGERIETDPQRLGQILRNLLSNALKFTERGEVSLRVFAAAEGMVSFAVRDTGMGIPAHQQAVIFEAFRQADGSTHRKYGGTGLGLSISRDLARLLGGDITLQSVVGQGSEFVLTLPIVYRGAADLHPAIDRPAERSTGLETSGPDPRGDLRGGELRGADLRGADSRGAEPRPDDRRADGTRSFELPAPPSASRMLHPVPIEDDRDRLLPDTRCVLVIEDDARFAAILRDLAHERGFQCIVTHTANDGLAAAASYRPSAILLDINLPDHSGLGVLDHLKHHSATRHIPVHVLSVADYTQEALERGAIGYALKPVKREQLVDAFRHLEAKLAQILRRVLVVEDDQRQRESIRVLLENADVQITGVRTAAEALAQLKVTTFDCVVMDLNLPDLSGYQLLEKMAGQDEVAFPPVIVYTGRSLSRDEEQGLRRFSKAIIIKDVRSPERLLDEVTLFLHQMEDKLPLERQRMLKTARSRETALEDRRILVVEDDVRNIFALSSVLEPKGAVVEIARNGREAIEVLTRSLTQPDAAIDLVLMDIMMPEMDGLTAMRAIRKRPEWKKLPIIALTAKAMKDDQEKCLDAGANDYIAKPLDVEKLLSLVRVWMPKR